MRAREHAPFEIKRIAGFGHAETSEISSFVGVSCSFLACRCSLMRRLAQRSGAFFRRHGFSSGLTRRTGPLAGRRALLRTLASIRLRVGRQVARGLLAHIDAVVLRCSFNVCKCEGALASGVRANLTFRRVELQREGLPAGRAQMYGSAWNCCGFPISNVTMGRAKYSRVLVEFSTTANASVS